MRVAKDVRRTKTDAILDPMPADERKAVHNHLAGMEVFQLSVKEKAISAG